MNTSGFSIGQAATLACCLEATVPKPGNVHRSADFEDTRFQDFITSAVAIGPPLDHAQSCPLGQTIYDCMRATRRVVNVNTNLGLVLLIAPLASVAQVTTARIEDLITSTDSEDSRLVYQSIRLANPGSLGTADVADVHGPPPAHILDGMRLSIDRDLVAKQYCTGFSDLLEFVVPTLCSALETMPVTNAVIWTHLQLMHKFPDSLIARKNGLPVAQQSAALAGRVLKAGQPGDTNYLRELTNLDFWLRADGNRRNPGTTADMIGAALFVALRNETISFPLS